MAQKNNGPIHTHKIQTHRAVIMMEKKGKIFFVWFELSKLDCIIITHLIITNFKVLAQQTRTTSTHTHTHQRVNNTADIKFPGHFFFLVLPGPTNYSTYICQLVQIDPFHVNLMTISNIFILLHPEFHSQFVPFLIYLR